MKTFAVATALAAGMLIASPAFAQSTTTPGTSSGSTMSHPSTMSSNEHGSAAMNPHSLSQNQIKSVQEKLQHDGYYKEGKVDGNWGPETHQALQKFQQDHKLNANGELDQQTLAALGIQGGSWSTAGASTNGSATSSQSGMGSSSMGASSSSTAPHPASGSAGMNSTGAKTH